MNQHLECYGRTLWLMHASNAPCICDGKVYTIDLTTWQKTNVKINVAIATQQLRQIANYRRLEVILARLVQRYCNLQLHKASTQNMYNEKGGESIGSKWRTTRSCSPLGS